MLTGYEIKRLVDNNYIYIQEFNTSRLGPNSYNLRLGNKLLVYASPELDMKVDNPVREIEIPEEGLVLVPHCLYLGQTVESTICGNYIPMIEGRSSVGRLGIFVHATAGFGDIGFAGRWTLEISCVQPVRIYAGVEICQIYFEEPTGYIMNRYEGKYQNQEGVTASKLYLDFQK